MAAVIDKKDHMCPPRSIAIFLSEVAISHHLRHSSSVDRTARPQTTIADHAISRYASESAQSMEARGWT